MENRLNEVISLLTDSSPKPTRRLLNFMDRLRGAEYERDDPAQLIAYMISLAAEAKAQLYQDAWASWVSGRKTSGFFVEFGAADGVFLSNTWLLENRFGWSGILAEPNPTYAGALKANRNCAVSTKCVYSVSDETLEFLVAVKPEYSRLSQIVPEDLHEGTRRETSQLVPVQTVSLNDLLIEHDAPHIIDYLSVDTEGSELAILSTFDFDRWDVRAISVEHNFSPDRERLHELLTANGYRRQWTKLSLFDDWYVRD